MQISITTPGSKSISNRALFLSAFSEKPIKFKNLADCDDTAYMLQGLKKLKGSSPIKIYTGNAGTTTRFLTALATLSGKKIIIDGDKRMKKRPIDPLAKALNKLGAKVKTTNGCPPLTIEPQKLKGGTVSIPGNISSQYISALLMLAPFAEKETTINIVQKLYSKSYIKMTIKLMKAFGIKVLNKNFKQFRVKPQKIKFPSSYTIESDASSASYIGGYAALHPNKTIAIKNLSKKSIQGDIKFLSLLEKMGNSTPLKALGKVDMNETPDLVMTFAILAAYAKGTTHITNIANLRIKETDRLHALKNELSKLGIKVKTTKDSIKIEGNPKLIENPPTHKITIETYNDHRMAMCFGMIQDLIPHLKIKNPSCVSKSYSTFWKDLKLMQKNGR
ncbi:MAG: 3-phosphoshikimate 1-carboxyvinyltransferase [Nitrospirota bacterium]